MTFGAQQGDPLQMLHFVFVLQPELQEINDRFGLTIGAYLNSLKLVEPVDRVAEALLFIKVMALSRGVHLNMSKTVVWILARRLSLMGTHVQWILASILGGPEFISRNVMKCIDTCINSPRRKICLMLHRDFEGTPKLVYCWKFVLSECLAESSIVFLQRKFKVPRVGLPLQMPLISLMSSCDFYGHTRNLRPIQHWPVCISILVAFIIPVTAAGSPSGILRDSAYYEKVCRCLYPSRV